MKLTRRFLALLLALSMSLSMVTPAFASETPDEIEEPVEVVEEVIDVVDADADADVEEEAEEPAPVVEEEDVPVVEEEAEEPAPVVEEEDVPVVEEEAEEPAPVVEEEDVPVVEEEAEEPAPVVEEEIAEEEAAGEEGTDPAVGTQENPLWPEWVWNEAHTEATVEITVEPGETYYFNVISGGVQMTINDGEAVTVKPNVNPRNPDLHSITNEGAEAATYTVKLTVPVGSMDNPDEVILDEDQTANVEADSQGYFYTWTAPAAGTLDFVIDATCTNWAYVVNNITGGIYGDFHSSADGEEAVMFETVSVEKDDVVQINIGTADGNAGTVKFTTSFAKLGSAELPLLPEWKWNEAQTEATVEITVEAGETYYFHVVYGNGAMLSINDGEAVAVNGGFMMPAQKTITNEGVEAATYTVKLFYPVGTMVNAEKLIPGNEASAAVEADSQGYFYTWTAPAAGNLSFEIDETCTNWTYVINNVTSGIYGEIHTSEDGEAAVKSDLIAVEKDDVINITIGTADRAAGSVKFSTSFAKLGSIELPVDPAWVWDEAGLEATASITVEAGDTCYFNVTVGEGAKLSIDDGEAVAVNGSRMMPEVHSVTNNTEAEATYALKLFYPVGVRMNPEFLYYTRYIAASLEEGNDQGYFFKYIASEEGTLVLTAADAENIGYDVVISNNTSFVQATMMENGNGTVSMPVMPGDELIIQLVTLPDENFNYPATEAVVYGNFVYPVGHMSNPEAIELGDVSVDLAAGTEGYNYSWTATGTGYMTFKMITKDGWSYTISNVTAGTYGDFTTSDDGSAIASLYVHEGEEIQIAVNTYDPENPWAAPAGTIKFNLSLNAATKEVVSGKKLTLTFMNNGKKVSGSKVNWTVVDAYVYNPYGEPVHFDDTTAYATLKNGTLTTKKCGDQIHMVINATLKADPSVTATYYVDILPAATKLAIWANAENTWTPIWNNVMEWDANGITAEDAVRYMYAFSFPNNANQNVKWTSSNKKVITIDEDGTMHLVGNPTDGYKTGTVTITATATDGSKKKASIKVNVVKLAKSIEIVRKDGKALEQYTYSYDEEEITYNGTIVDAGKSINLVAKLDANATNKKITWESYSNYVKVSKSGKVTVSKDAPDGYRAQIRAYTTYHSFWEGDFDLSAAFVIEVNNDKVTVSLWDEGMEYEMGKIWMDGPNAITINATGLTADELPTVTLRGVVLNSNNEYLGDVQNYKLSNPKLLDMEVVPYWDNGYAEGEYWIKVKNYDMDAKPEGWSTEYEVQLTPKVGVTGKTTVTAISPDGKAKATYTITVAAYASKLEITTKNGKNLGKTTIYHDIYDEYGNYIGYEEEEITAVFAAPGQTISLKAVTDTKEKVYWEAIEGTYGGANKLKINNGKLTLPKDIAEETWIQVQAYTYNCWTDIYIIVTPKAVNVHLRAQFSEWEPMKYVSNTTKAWDITADRDWDGQADTTMELSALVYPFSASQNVKWTVSNNKVATVVENKDGTATLKFTGKTGKLTVTATTEDGSKIKSSFTLNVVKSVKSLELKSDLTVNAGKKLAVNKALTINPGDATNKKVTWSMQMLDENGALVDVPKTIATLSSSGSLATKKAAAGVTIYVTATAKDGFGATVTQPVIVK